MQELNGRHEVELQKVRQEYQQQLAEESRAAKTVLRTTANQLARNNAKKVRQFCVRMQESLHVTILNYYYSTLSDMPVC